LNPGRRLIKIFFTDGKSGVKNFKYMCSGFLYCISPLQSMKQSQLSKFASLKILYYDGEEKKKCC